MMWFLMESSHAQSFTITNDSIRQFSGSPNALRVYCHLTLVPSSVAKIEIFFSEFSNCIISEGGGQQTISAPWPLSPVFVNSTFQITKTGYYYARCTGYDDKGNYNFSTPIIQIYVAKIITGTEPIKPQAITVYPNPATDIIHVPFATTYSIINMSGAEIKGTTDGIVDVSGLIPGLYIIQTEKGVGRFQKK